MKQQRASEGKIVGILREAGFHRISVTLTYDYYSVVTRVKT